MDTGIEFEQKELSASETQWLQQLLCRAALAYSYSNKAEDKEQRETRIRNNFIRLFEAAILEKIGHLASVRETLTKKIYGGDVATLLQRIGNALYRKYIEDKDGTAEVIISKKNLAKLDVSQAKFIRYTKMATPFFEDFIETKIYIDGPKVIMELFLIL